VEFGTYLGSSEFLFDIALAVLNPRVEKMWGVGQALVPAGIET